MKKVFCILIAFFCITVASQAQICKISGANDNVEVQDVTWQGYHVYVTVGNDSQDISANVTIEVEVEYEYFNSPGTFKKSFSAKKTVKPNGETEIKIKTDAINMRYIHGKTETHSFH